MPDLKTYGSMKGRFKGGELTADAMHMVILYRILDHIHANVEALMAAGGEGMRNALELFQTMQAERRQ